MSNEDIKNEYDRLCEDVRIAHARIRRLRLLCKHKETFIGSYQWRPGSTSEATMCKFCHQVMPTPESKFEELP